MRKLRVHALVFCMAVAAALVGGAAASADEVKVMISGGFASAYRDLGPQFEQTTGRSLITVWGPALGTARTSIPVRLARGEWADVLIVTSYALDTQIDAGKIVPGSQAEFARSGIGLAVREDAPKPDVSSVDALRRTLLAAKSIAYPDDASGIYIATELFWRLGIAGQMATKSRMIPAEEVARAVVSGQAEIGLQQTVELLPVKGLTVAGSLPADVQRYIVFSGGISTSARNPAGAQALIRFLSSPDAAPAISRSGLEPLAPMPTLTPTLTPTPTPTPAN